MLSTQIGRLHLGAGPLGGPALYDLPTVTLDAIGTLSAVTSLTVAWTYAQAQSRPQLAYRLIWTRDSDSLEYLNTGWITSAVDEHVITWSDIDVASMGENTGTITIDIRMDASDGQDPGEATDDEGFTTQLGFPHMTITAPTEGSTVETAQATLTWTFTDDRGGRTQGKYRVQLLRTGDGFELYDSGWLLGAVTSHLIPIALNHGTNYTIKGQLQNDLGVLSD